MSAESNLHSYGNIATERHGRVFVVRVNRPAVLNAIDYDTTLELHQAWNEFRDDPDIWVGVLTGTGDRAFSAGADLKAHGRVGLETYLQKARVPFGAITDGLDTWKPLIAAINGLALGGGLEMALACDIRLAVPHAEFGLPEARWGLIAAGGGLVRLPRLLPMAKAMEVVLMGKRLSIDEALQYGLVNAVVPADRLMATAIQWAERICEMGPLAVRASKEIMVRTLDIPLRDGLAIDDYYTRYISTTEDSREGLRAFAEKRKPNFQAM